MSDLHLEVNPSFRASPAPGADLLVLAGDIGSYQPRSQLMLPNGRRDFGLSRFSPRDDRNTWHERGWPTPVIYVPGNHEFDGLDRDATRAELAELCSDLGITLLDDAVHHIGDVRFIGSTLWSDFDALAEATQYKPRSYASAEARRIDLRQKAYRAANHHLVEFHFTQQGKPQLAPEVREVSLAAQAWLAEQLAAPHPAGAQGKTVVITHFAPSLRSHDPRYGLQPGTAGFCNAMDALVPKADAWIHGHLHCASRYSIAACQVRANPLGYAGSNEQKGFEPWACVEV